MRAAYYEQTGSSDVIQVGEIPTPDPGPGEVRVKIAVSGVNPTDWKSRAGSSGGVAGERQVPNQDGAGVIDAVGDGVPESRVGERVWLSLAAYQSPWGTAAEYSVVPAEKAVPLPDGVSFELGATLGVPAMTAHRCLFADGPIEGRAVLVAGGAGAVGREAIELAKWAGAKTIVATVSNDEKAEIARAAGATATVNYKADDATEQLKKAAPDGVDRIVELSLGHNLDFDLAGAAPNCSIVSYANEGDNPELEVRKLMIPNINLRFMLLYTVPTEALEQAKRDITKALEDGAITEPRFHRFSLDETAKAHDAVEQGAVGKVLIDVS
jgi:NADPH2:quinone reductase